MGSNIDRYNIRTPSGAFDLSTARNWRVFLKNLWKIIARPGGQGVRGQLGNRQIGQTPTEITAEFDADRAENWAVFMAEKVQRKAMLPDFVNCSGIYIREWWKQVVIPFVIQ